MLDFDPEILQDFLTESGELLDSLEADLVELERDPSDLDLINQIFRALHTVKGSASFLSLGPVVEIAHAAETALNSARNGEFVVGRTAMDLLLRATDILTTQLKELSGGQTDLTAAEPGLVSGLIALAEGGSPDAEEAPTAVATAEPSGGPGPATGGGVKPLELDESKADLLPHFAEDLEDILRRIEGQVAALADDARRLEAADRIAMISEELAATGDFFEFGEMLELSDALAAAAASVRTLDAEAMGQLLPRTEAVLSLLGEQHAGILRHERVSPEAGTLIERIRAVASGKPLPEGAQVPADATPDTVFEVDGVVRGGKAPSADRSDSDPADPKSADPDPASEDAAGTQTSSTEPARSEPAPSERADPGPERAASAGPDDAPPRRQAEARQANAPEQTLRVEVGRLETLMNLVGELVLQKNRVCDLAERIDPGRAVDQDLAEAFELTSGMLARITSEIQVAVMRTRMQPLDKLFGKYPRLIRDLAAKTGKEIRLDIKGGETEVDKSVIENLGDPLVHIMRNSADHGLEGPDERQAAGKDRRGTITLAASQQGNHVEIEIRDDGRGLNRERIAAKATERGLATREEIEHLSDDEVGRFIFLPGFSTTSEVSDLSGRGVGMDVVLTNIRKLEGDIAVRTEQGRGTSILITIPLTVAIMPAMMVRVHAEQYAMPLASIVEIVRPDDRQLSSILESRVIRLRDEVIQIVDAAEVLGVPAPPAGETDAAPRLCVVVEAAGRRLGVLVTRVVGQQEIVIKPLESGDKSQAVSGATVRNDGGVSLIVDVASLVRQNV